MNQPMDGIRRKDVDAVAGLMILWMVVGHLRQVCGYEWQSPSVLFFFMPWFYYKSGMLWKSSTLIDSANKGVKKLLVPFIYYAIAGQLLRTICLLTEGVTELKPYLYSPLRSLVLGGTVGGNPPLWFIPSLFVVQCIACWLISKRDVPYLWAFVSIALGFGEFLIEPKFMPTYVESAFGGLFFFFMGNWLKDWQYKWWVTVICSVCVIAILLFGIDGFEIRENSAGTGGYFLGVLASLVGCMAINGLVRWMQPYLKFYVLQYVGKNAMTIYVTHWIVLALSVELFAIDLLHIADGKCLLFIGGISLIVMIPVYICVSKYVRTRKNPD